MLFLAVLLLAALGTLPSSRLRERPRDRWRYALGAAMAVAGVAHLVAPTPFVQHLPAWVPARSALVSASGLAEIALGAAIVLVPPRLRSRAGTALALYLVAVFPANVYVAVAGVDVEGQPGGIYPWIRLPWQALYVWLAVWTTRSPLRPLRHRTLDDRPAPVGRDGSGPGRTAA